MPLSLIFVGMVLFNNLCLKYVEVSFYQVSCLVGARANESDCFRMQIARSLTILCQIVLTYFMLGKTTSTTAIAGCGIVVLGFVVTRLQCTTPRTHAVCRLALLLKLVPSLHRYKASYSASCRACSSRSTQFT
jgi:hypothetical protein